MAWDAPDELDQVSGGSGVTQGAFKNVEGLDSELEYQDGDDPLTRKRPGRI